MSTALRRSIIVPIEHGVAELVPDPRRPAGWTLLIDGVAQSYVDVDDPRFLEFPYVRRVASILDALPAPGRALHLGAGGMTIPRYLGVSRPGTHQVVVERDAALILLVHKHIPVPAETGAEIRVGSAREAVEKEPDDEYDLVVGDAYVGATMPADVTSVEHARQVARVLRPDGTYVVNVTDLPALAFTRIQAATLRAVFGHVAVLSDATMLRGRKFGNVVLVASARELPLRDMARVRPGEVTTVRVLSGDDLGTFIGGARPLTDEGRDGQLNRP